MRLKSEIPKVDLNMYVEEIDSYKINDNTNLGIAYFVDKFHENVCNYYLLQLDQQICSNQEVLLSTVNCTQK